MGLFAFFGRQTKSKKKQNKQMDFSYDMNLKHPVY